MRIIGIKLFESKWKSVNKILEPGWYPFGNFPEPKDGIPYYLPKRASLEKKLYDIYDNMPHIEVSCIVGKNGSGKSTLLDILYRLINNFSYEVLGNNKQNQLLEHADGLNARLYYEIDDVVYMIKCCEKEVSFYVMNQEGSFVEQQLGGEQSVLSEKFFYTISTNFSLYALNENDYEEYGERDNGESEHLGKWIPCLFHQNNGYQTPIVITPSRKKGCIDIDKENRLAKQRIITMGILAVAKNQPQLIEGYSVRALRYKLIRNYRDILKNKYPSEWGKKRSEDCILYWVLKDFERVWENKLQDKLSSRWGEKKANFNFDTVNLIDLLYNPRELVLSYLAYKSLKICTFYEDYKAIFETDDFLKACNSGAQFIYADVSHPSRFEKKIKMVVDRLCDKQFDSHENLKIRQCLNYLDSPLFHEDYGEIEIKDILEGKNIQTLSEAAALLLPPFFDVDLVIENDDNKERMTVSSMSSGERQILYSFSYVMYELMNLQTVRRYKSFTLIFDEAELYYHPDYQRVFIKKLIDNIKWCNLDTDIIKSLNIIIVTHSPFVLSDILTSNTLYLSKGHREVVERQSFGANFYDMLQESFFFEDTPFGEVASYTIDKLIEKKNQYEGNFDMDIDTIQSIIGDPIIANYLLSNLSFHYVPNRTRRD